MFISGAVLGTSPQQHFSVYHFYRGTMSVQTKSELRVLRENPHFCSQTGSLNINETLIHLSHNNSMVENIC